MATKRKTENNMIDPPIGELLKKVDSVYTLVKVVAERAGDLERGANKLTDCTSEKPVTLAANELHEDMLTYLRRKSGIK